MKNLIYYCNQLYTIISCYELRKHNLKKQSNIILSILRNMTETIFINFVKKMLLNSKNVINDNDNDDDDEDDEGLNERLLCIAMIGRINCE